MAPTKVRQVVIVDSHCHIWETWPYEPAVPDPFSRARAEQLLFEMDRAGVERAVVICAAIGGNPRNTDYAFDMATRHPGRLTIFPDLECRWSPDYQKPGACLRLELALSRWDFRGFTLYPEEAEDGSWLVGEEAEAFFEIAAARGLIASLSVLPHQMPAVAALADRHPNMPILCHHMAHLGPKTAATENALAMVLAAASRPNISVKLSGMGNVGGSEDEYPYPGLSWIFQVLKEAFGPDRLLWASDYPVSRRHMTYTQTLAMARRHMPFEGEALAKILGGNMLYLLD